MIAWSFLRFKEGGQYLFNNLASSFCQVQNIFLERLSVVLIIMRSTITHPLTWLRIAKNCKFDRAVDKKEHKKTPLVFNPFGNKTRREN